MSHPTPLDHELPASGRSKKVRPFWEKVLVWGGISILLVLVLVEWSSKTFYEGTINRLDHALRRRNPELSDRRMKLHEANNEIRGFTFCRKEETKLNRRMIYTWPSVFKTYHAVLVLGAQDEVVALETQINYDLPEPAQKAGELSFEAKSLLKGRRVRTGDQVVQLAADDEPKSNSQEGRYGTLVRELVRQAVLITAREELGLNTRDASLGEVILVEDHTLKFPLHVMSSIRLQAFTIPTCLIRIERVHPDGKIFRWNKDVTFGPSDLEDLVVQLEELSRTELVQVLQDAGYRKRDRSREGSSVEGTPSRLHLTVVSQFAELRRLHADRFAKGETDQTTESLIRTYANLGDLTSYYWNATSKAFKARSLLYAQRHFVKRGATSSTLAHRAYSRALTGRHLAALEDVQAARLLEAETTPGWLKLIDAYCSYRPEILEQPHPADQELAVYLQMLASRDTGSEKRTANAINRFLRVEPGSLRACQSFCEMDSLRMSRMMTEGGFDDAWSAIYGTFSSINDFPATARRVVEEQLEQQQLDLASEYRTRVRLFQALREAAADPQDLQEVSWTMLSALLEEATFTQVTEVLRCEKLMLGVSSERSIARLRPLIANHPFKDFLEAFTDDDHANAGRLSSFASQFNNGAYEPQMKVLAGCIHHIAGSEAYSQFYHKMFACRDLIYDDLLNEQGMAQPARQIWVQDLRNVSPFQPASVAQLIPFDWDNTKDLIAEREETYAKCPNVMIALGRKYQRLRRSDEAIRCFKQSIAAEPSYDAYESLADEYYNRNDLDAYQETLDDSLDLPDFDLKKSRIQIRLADFLMRKGDWNEARPYAMEAASTFSAMGLIAGSRCAEGLNDWKTAEAMRQLASQRYTELSADWYFWCIRTGRGDLEAARNQAAAHWQTFKDPLTQSQKESLFYRDLIDGQTKQALQIIRTLRIEPRHPLEYIDYNLDPRLIMHAAVIADETKEIAFRDKLFKILPTLTYNQHDSQIVNLANLLLRASKEPDTVTWDEKSFDDLIVRANVDEVTFLYYVTGRFLSAHGLDAIGRRYLEVAATSFSTEKRSCMLAALALRQLQVEVGKTRLTEFPDDLAEVCRKLDTAGRLRAVGNHAQAEQQFREALQLRPSLSEILVATGRFNMSRGEYDTALKNLQDALQLNPENVEVHRSLGWLRATCEDASIRNATDALQHANAARELQSVRDYLTYTVLAAAHAENGDFDDAVRLENQALGFGSGRNEDFERLLLYRNQKPFHGHQLQQKPAGEGPPE